MKTSVSLIINANNQRVDKAIRIDSSTILIIIGSPCQQRPKELLGASWNRKGAIMSLCHQLFQKIERAKSRVSHQIEFGVKRPSIHHLSSCFNCTHLGESPKDDKVHNKRKSSRR
jgi:hypothetical protein